MVFPQIIIIIIIIITRHSIIKNVISGVPQGSVLGPILFIIYINHIESVVKTCSIGSFADGTKKIGRIITSQDTTTLQKDLNNVVQWSLQNNMVLHEDKFVYLCYKTNKSKRLCELLFTAELAEYPTPLDLFSNHH